MTQSAFHLVFAARRARLWAIGFGLSGIFSLTLVLASGALTPSVVAAGPSARSSSEVARTPLVINGLEVDPQTRAAFETRYGLSIPGGTYWYDRVSGAWGWQGGPTVGFTLAGLNIGGALQVSASGGSDAGLVTGVFVNGRELHPLDVLALSQLVPVSPGRFWLDSAGNAGYVGGAAMVNLWQVARRNGTGGAYQRSTAGGYIGGDGQTSYFFDPETGSSVMVGN